MPAAPAGPAGAGLPDDPHNRLLLKLRTDPWLARRWGGAVDGLHDTTRSGLDMSLGSMLKPSGKAPYDGWQLCSQIAVDAVIPANRHEIEGTFPLR